ncbi:RIO1 family regulatory kinase/ATPase domain-containing protein [Neobacillus ginsengisoli]|uniref:non-specific serine/threonine protein kinase n=1 Tax=Neobacillus ginsengisoli TaxID=904295 RepID=A0ABT9XPM3_9BACI|nr:RIO1 family regulatory kinase/ATPase [Neobacillus ginsengisoli]MDQ0197477.1 RIO-like serine/threonine protein kinase [Neobacillus ginsengisoli]
MDDFHKITIEKQKGLKINNPTHYELIGQGVQGAVFRLSEDRCLKMYARERHCLREIEALNAGKDSSIVPKVFEVGENYIVMEFIKGQPLKDYLESLHSIPEPIAKQLIFIFKEMKRIGFTRIDASIRHLIVTDDGEIKVVDHVNSLEKQHPWPFLFFRSLTKLNLLDTFLNQLKEMDPELYWEWNKWMDKSKN